MGNTYQIQCQKCDFARDITIGVGFLFGNIDDIIISLQGQDKATVLSLKKQKLIFSHLTNGFSLYQCKDCDSIENKCHLSLYDKNGKNIFETSSYCSPCQKNRSYLPEDMDKETIPDLKCPKCHHSYLLISPLALWD